MRDWKLSGRTQQQPQQQRSNRSTTTNNNVAMNETTTIGNSAPMKGHGVHFSMVSRFQYGKSEDRRGPEVPASSTMHNFMSQGCVAGNRSRADSGTSTYSGSSSCDGAEIPLLGQLQKKTRKRSHRPRGCRGGSSRRGANRKMANHQLLRTQQQDDNGPSGSNGSSHMNMSLVNDVPLENMYPYQVYQNREPPQPVPYFLIAFIAASLTFG